MSPNLQEYWAYRIDDTGGYIRAVKRTPKANTAKAAGPAKASNYSTYYLGFKYRSLNTRQAFSLGLLIFIIV